MNAGRTKGKTRDRQTPEGKHTFLVKFLAELQAIVKQIEPTPNPYLEDGMPVDFRRLSLTLPSRKTVDAALSCIKGGADYEELGRRARRWENDYTQFKIQQKCFHEECQNMDVAENRRTHGTLSDAPQALEQFRRNLMGDIQWLEGIVGDSQTARKPRRKIRHIHYKVALAILERLNCPRKRKELQRWMNGQNTPEDFTPECMATVQAFTAWAQIWANREQAKINTNNALRIDNPDNRKMGKYR